jgi:hypothetical protein
VGYALHRYGSGEGSTVTSAAAPEGRECVVVLQVAMYVQADVDTGQHILDTFEVDCGRVREGEPVPSMASASASSPPCRN